MLTVRAARAEAASASHGVARAGATQRLAQRVACAGEVALELDDIGVLLLDLLLGLAQHLRGDLELLVLACELAKQWRGEGVREGTRRSQ